MRKFNGTSGEWYKMKADQMGVPFIVASGNETLFQVYGEDAEANAKLIAAAPEILEMLQKINLFINVNKDKNYMIELLNREAKGIEDLILKATDLNKMEKPSLEEVWNIFKNADKVIGVDYEDVVFFTKGIEEPINEFLGSYWIKIKGNASGSIKLWDKEKGHAKILTYKNTEPKFEITKELIIILNTDGNKDVRKCMQEWFPEVFETVLEVGKWYKTQHDAGINLFRFNGKFDKEKDPKGYGFDSYGKFRTVENSGFGFYNNNPKLATAKEVAKSLKNEGKRIGYDKLNTFVKSLVFNETIVNLSESGYEQTGYRLEPNGEFIYNGVTIMKEGIWAEIIPTKTIQEAEELLKELGHNFKIV